MRQVICYRPDVGCASLRTAGFPSGEQGEKKFHMARGSHFFSPYFPALRSLCFDSAHSKVFRSCCRTPGG